LQVYTSNVHHIESANYWVMIQDCNAAGGGGLTKSCVSFAV
jgi:hypothetical protein